MTYKYRAKGEIYIEYVLSRLDYLEYGCYLIYKNDLRTPPLFSTSWKYFYHKHLASLLQLPSKRSSILIDYVTTSFQEYSR